MYLVAYDGSTYAQGALIRAVEFADLADVDVEAYAVVPEGGEHGTDRTWVEADGDGDADDVVETLHEQVAALAPEAEFNYDTLERGASGARVAREIRERARSVDADVVFLGSESAGREVTSIGDVEDSVVAEPEFDAVLVRTHPRQMTDVDDDRREPWLREDTPRTPAK